MTDRSLRERAIEAAKLQEDERARQKEEAVRVERKAKEDALIKRIGDVLGVKDASVQWVQGAPCSTIEGLDIFDRPKKDCLVAGVRCPGCGEYFGSTYDFNDLAGFGRALLFLEGDPGECRYCRRLKKEKEDARKKAEEAMLNPPESADTEATCRVQESSRPPWWRRLAGAR